MCARRPIRTFRARDGAPGSNFAQTQFPQGPDLGISMSRQRQTRILIMNGTAPWGAAIDTVIKPEVK